MNIQLEFISKILIISTILSVVIKYGGRYLPIPPTNAIALTIVVMPSLIIGLILGWQYLKQKV